MILFFFLLWIETEKKIDNLEGFFLFRISISYLD